MYFRIQLLVQFLVGGFNPTHVEKNMRSRQIGSSFPQLPAKKKSKISETTTFPPVVGKLIRFSSFRGSGPFLVGPRQLPGRWCDLFVRGTAVATRC